MIKAVEMIGEELLERTEDEKEYVGGIPKEIFDKEIPYVDEEVVGKSGAKFYVFMNEEEVTIEPYNDSYCIFKAEVNEEGMMQLDVRTKYPDETKHPDLYAGELLRASYNFFGRYGVGVQFIKGRWHAPVPGFSIRSMSDNYMAFMESLDGELYPNSERLVEAAQSTWTGKMAGELGFSKVYPWNIDINKGTNGQIINIEVIFEK